MNRILIILATTLLLHACSSNNQEQQENFNNGNYAYSEKNYATAIDRYEAIVQLGSEAFEMYYNLGNAYFRKGDYPRAILNYERAARFNPHDEDNINNLALANSKIQDRFEVMPEIKAVTLWKKFSYLFNSAAWAFITVGFLALLLVSLFFYVMYPSYTIKKTSFYTGIVFLFCMSLSLTATFSAYGRETEKSAIVMAFSTNLLSEPESSSTAKTIIHAGSKLLLMDKIGSYYKVQLPNGEKGWVATSDIAPIL
ncbi:MAG: tetratricopeptide repeat protein [Bacteroidales bacterium]|jgi:tetratricopeptide (TPR) repeat protein|nr:tetratricopeptide repeat protein [Bacteroidales bacterium]